MNVAILGAGISGLSTAYFLNKLGGSTIARITVLEASGRVGGWLKSEKHDGFLFERGCRGFRPKGNGALALRTIEELGIQGQAELANAAAGHRYILMDGKLEHVPTGVFELFGSPLMRNIVPSILRDAFASRQLEVPADESVHAFISRRFSPSFADNLVDPMISGIYAGDIRKLSILSVFPFLKRWEELHGSVIRGAISEALASRHAGPPEPKSSFQASAATAASVSFRDGMETFPRALLAKLQASLNCEVRLNESVTQLHRDKARVGVTSTDALGATRVDQYDHVVSTLPSNALATVLSASPVASEAVANDGIRALAGIPRASAAVINFGYRSSVLGKANGFGYLIPSSQNEDVLGVVWDSCTFPGQGAPGETRVTVMAGGARNPGIESATESQLISMAQSALTRHMGLTATPDCIVAGVHKGCIPQPIVGHAARVRKAREATTEMFSGRLRLAGNSYDGIGASDCVNSGLQTARAILKQ